MEMRVSSSALSSRCRSNIATCQRWVSTGASLRGSKGSRCVAHLLNGRVGHASFLIDAAAHANLTARQNPAQHDETTHHQELGLRHVGQQQREGKECRQTMNSSQSSREQVSSGGDHRLGIDAIIG